MSIPGSASPLFIGAAAAAEAGYQIDRSVRLNSADSAYFSRTPSSAGNRRTWTWSGWVKRSTVGDGNWRALFTARNPDNANRNDGIWYSGTSGSLPIDQLYISFGDGTDIQFAPLFRDVSAWYHVVVAADSTQSTASDRIKAYVNGVQLSLDQGSQPAQNYEAGINNTTSHSIGRRDTSNAQFLDGYLADVHFIDGQALAASDFGEYDSNNVWQPKAYSGSYGTNGFKLDFSDNTSTTTISEDSSGNNNDWTANNISVASGAGNDSLIDTPTNYEADSGNNGGNYATFNPLDSHSQWTLSNGNLEITKSSSGGDRGCFLTLGPTSGKFYWEVTFTALASENYIGLAKKGRISVTTDIYSGGTDAYMYRNNGNKHGQGNASGGESYGASWTTNDVIGVAVDWDAGNITFYKNGTSQGTAWTGQDFSEYMPAVYANTNQSPAAVLNTGARPFAYTPPTGYVSLCTQNLPNPTIADGSTAMDAKLYTGNGSTQTISGLGFSPDLVWLKVRNTTYSHYLTDTVRGATKDIYTNATNAEGTDANGLTAFTSDGFTLGTDTGRNESAKTYVGWAWDGGTSTVSNTDGSITSSVRASQTNGFSIVTYTGDSPNVVTVGHGLNAAPDMIIIKGRSRAVEWPVYHSALGNTKTLYLNQTDGQLDGHWNNTTPTSSVFTLGDSSYVNFNDDLYVAYCFAPVAGYSAFGSYTGNGSTDGPLVYTGFRPRWVLFKNASGSFAWHLYDTARDTFNLCDARLRPDSSAVEDADNQIDILSNGFKPRTSGNGSNQSGSTFIYAAFAEHPFKYSRAR